MKALIICPIQEEFDAVKGLLKSDNYRKGKYTKRSYLFGRHANHSVALILSGRGGEAVVNTLHTAIRDFDFTHVFLVGTAGGITKVKQGDIVIASKSYQYEWGREMDNSFHTFPKGLNAEVQFLRFMVGKKDQIIAGSAELNKEVIKVFFKPIASGSKVIESTKNRSYQLLRERYNDAIALEMEAYAFQSAINHYPEIQAANIRGIADMLSDKQKANANGSKAIAARHAAQFTLGLIEQLKPKSSRRQYLQLAVAALILIALSLGWVNFSPSTTEQSVEQEGMSSLIIDDVDIERTDSSLISQSTNPVEYSAKPVAVKQTAPAKVVFSKIQTADLTNEATEDIGVSETTEVLDSTIKDELVWSSDPTVKTTEEIPSTDTPAPTPKSEAVIHKYVDRCYVGVTHKGKKISNVSIYIDGKEVQTANHRLSLPVGKHWMILKKGNKFYREKIEIRDGSSVKPTFMVEWEEFEEKAYELNADQVKITSDIR